MMPKEIFKKRVFLWYKDTLEWKIRIRGLVFDVTRILLKGKDLNQKCLNWDMWRASCVSQAYHRRGSVGGASAGQFFVF